MPPRTLLVVSAFLAFFSLGLPDGLLGVAWPSIRADFGVPLDALGLLGLFSLAGYLTASFLSGRVLRVLSVGTVLALSTVAAAAALLGYALSPVWPPMLALGFLAGLGGGAVDAALNAYGAARFSARMLNWLHAFFGLGTALGPLMFTALLGVGLEWRWGYALVGSVLTLLALTFFVTRGRWVQGAEAGNGEPSPRQAAHLRDTLRRPAIWLGMLVFFLYSGSEWIAGNWAYSLLTLERGLAASTAGVWLSLYWGSLMAGRVLFGLVADTVPLAATLRLCLAAATAGALLFWLEPTRPPALVGLMSVGLSLAPVFASLVSLTPARVGAAHADSAVGVQIAAAGLGGTVLPGLVGVLARSAGLWVVGAALFASAFSLLVVYEAFLRMKPQPDLSTATTGGID